jgi:hypothetical protein
VYSAPDEPATQENKVIRVPSGDKHVSMKLPLTDSASQTEVILPQEQDEHKNLVYVLLKKGEATSNLPERPAAPRQQKPEVYFIRYGNQQQQLQLLTGEETSTGAFHGCGSHRRKQPRQNRFHRDQKLS